MIEAQVPQQVLDDPPHCREVIDNQNLDVLVQHCLRQVMTGALHRHHKSAPDLQRGWTPRCAAVRCIPTSPGASPDSGQCRKNLNSPSPDGLFCPAPSPMGEPGSQPCRGLPVDLANPGFADPQHCTHFLEVELLVI